MARCLPTHNQSLYSSRGPLKIYEFAFGGDHFQNQDQLLDALAQKIDLLNIPATEVTILVKGSRSSHMEVIAQALINQESMPC